MALPRERATRREDLPHKFEGRLTAGCDFCGYPLLEPRHVAWEKAAVELDRTRSALPRETGI